jgi:probable F420-dependent oxidoreductase
MLDRKEIPLQISVNFSGAQSLVGGDYTRIGELAELAEAKGMDCLAVSEHVVMSANTQSYPYGDYPVPLDMPWLEPFQLLTLLAAHTKRATLTSGIIISPLRPAVLLAKQLATLDILSGGRVAIGLGVGWQKEEYDACGVPWDGRFGYLIEQIEVCRALFRNAPASFSGRHVAFDQLYSFPLPPQGAAMPILLGVAPSELNLRRIARHADGWLPMERDPAKLIEPIRLLTQFVEAEGRDPKLITVRAQMTLPAGPVTEWSSVLDHARAMQDAGVTTLQFAIARHGSNLTEATQMFEGFKDIKERLS